MHHVLRLLHHRDRNGRSVGAAEGLGRGVRGIELVPPGAVEIGGVDEVHHGVRWDLSGDDFLDIPARLVVYPPVDPIGRGRVGKVEAFHFGVEVCPIRVDEGVPDREAFAVPDGVGKGHLHVRVEPFEEVDESAVGVVDVGGGQVLLFQCRFHGRAGLSTRPVERHPEGHRHADRREKDVFGRSLRVHGAPEKRQAERIVGVDDLILRRREGARRRGVSGVLRAGRVAAEPEEHEEPRGHEPANEGGNRRVEAGWHGG